MILAVSEPRVTGYKSELTREITPENHAPSSKPALILVIWLIEQYFHFVTS